MPLPGWSMLVVSGADRQRFLHSQLTSDVATLAPGGAQPSALLDGRGRLVAQLWLRKGDESIDLLVPDPVRADAHGALERHVIADDVRVETRNLPEVRVALGPEAARLAASLDPGVGFGVEVLGERGFITWGPEPPPLQRIDPELVEALHVLGGWPRWGVEVRPGQLVTETRLMELAVSLHKGCFLGQETVAKVASRRGAATYPAALGPIGGDTDWRQAAGSSLRAKGRKVGTLLSAARWEGEWMLQAALHRDLRVEGMELACEVDGVGAVEAAVRLLPVLGLQTASKRADELHEHASRAFASDREAEAIRLLERAVAVCPDHADAYESLGVILGRRGDYGRAIELMHHLLAVDPGSVMAHTNLSLYYNHLGRIEDAERERDLAARAELEQRRRRRQETEAEDSEHQRRAADRRRREEMFSRVLEIDPEDPLALLGLGELRLEEERFSDAVEHLERSLEADPNASAAHLALGRAREGLGEPGRAADAYRRGLDVATRRGDLMTARRIHERLAEIADRARR